MDEAAFQIGKTLNEKKVTYFVHPPNWLKFNNVNLDLDFNNWGKIKYLTDDGNSLNEAVEEIPNNRGGLYLFFINCNVINGITSFPFYIGRAQYTEHQNLRKRVKEYFHHYANNDERPKIYKMLALWGPELHLAYFPVNNNDQIVNIEKEIINSLLLPMNDLIPNKTLKDAKKAFDL